MALTTVLRTNVLHCDLSLCRFLEITSSDRRRMCLLNLNDLLPRSCYVRHTYERRVRLSVCLSVCLSHAGVSQNL